MKETDKIKISQGSATEIAALLRKLLNTESSLMTVGVKYAIALFPVLIL